MKKMLSTVALAMCAVLVLSAIATAQPGQGRGQGRGQGGPGQGPGGGFMLGGGPGGGGGGVQMLLGNADLRAQLGITDEQVQKMDQIRQEARAAAPQRNRDAGPPTEAERAAMVQRQQETMNKVRAVLTPEQQEKAKVLTFQVAGGLGTANANVLEVLNLTDDQKAKLTAINTELADQRREIFTSLPGRDSDATPEARRAAFEAARTKIEDLTKAKVSAILTDAQKAQAAKLTEEGKEVREKFQQQMQQQMQQRGGNRGGQGGGQGGGEGGGAYQPGANSWQPGQGAGNQPRQGQQRRGGFPQRDTAPQQ